MDQLARSLRNGLVAPAVNRAAPQRDDESWLDTAIRSPASRFLPVWRDLNLIARQPPRAVLLTAEQCPALTRERYVLLGSDGATTYFALDLPSRQPSPTAWNQLGALQDLRQVGILLEDPDAALLAYARGLCFWHNRHRYCGVCGNTTHSLRAGHLRVCSEPTCDTPHFPRTDPAIIVLTYAGDRCLLGRKPEWPPGRFSTIAGFVEPGEAVEQAVVREVKEETGVEITRVSYHSSQPWPFPSSVMLGFHAQAASTDIRRGDDELEDVRWFSRSEIEQAVAKTGPLRLPPRISIARRLIEDWCFKQV